MWAKFDHSEFPIVSVKLRGKIKNNLDFYNFTTTWESYNLRGIPYVFVFDTREVGFVNIKYAFMMASFIKELKRKEQFLQGSIIIVQSKYLRFLLSIIFKLQKPVADVYMTDLYSEVFIQKLYNTINGNLNMEFSNVTIVRKARS
tara:strand:+ start:690 stop:1124 length:435 start_codon:yes stop_codon:yes gene_type:complete